MTQIKIIFSNLIKNTRKLLKKLTEGVGTFDQYQKQQVYKLLAIHRDYVELRVLQKKLDCFHHGWCTFKSIDRTEKRWLNDFDFKSCIKRVSSLFSEDYTHLFWIIYNSKETKYGNFDNTDFIINNDNILTYLQISLGYRMTINEIKEFILQEWNFGQEWNEDDYSDDNEVQADLEIGKNLNKSRYVI